MFSNSRNPIVDYIYQRIVSYNQNSDEADQIKFVHGGSSSVFAFIGREITIFEDDKVVKKIVPNALIPTGLLRKRYGLYPVSGELEVGAFNYGSRKAGINHHFLSGVEPTYSGLLEAFQYAKYSKRVPSVASIHDNISKTIEYIDKYLYIRSLKMLIMYFINMMLLSDNTEDAIFKGNNYLELLKIKFESLTQKHSDNQEIKTYLDKYLPKLEDIISGKTLPFISNASFISDVLNQYPIIFCSNVTPMDFSDGVPGEQIYKGELDMKTIKLIFAPDECVEDLKTKLKNSSLSMIQIVGYEPNENRSAKRLRF